MKLIKKLTAVAAIACLSLTVSAQGFSKFTIEGGMADGSIKNVKEGTSKIEVIAGLITAAVRIKSKPPIAPEAM